MQSCRGFSATWRGDLKQGRGILTTQSRTLDQAPYSYSMRFEDDPGTNPEELIGAAHAGCFTMDLSAALGKAGHVPEELTTFARVVLEKVDGQTSITTVHLELKGKVPGISPQKFEELAVQTKDGCIVSRLLRAKLTLDVQLELVPAH